ncbi:MAG: DNA-formamidopyrimidine glycosylase [Thermus sp.]|uniref:DNA-formamidopyrimidine glycosylase n=1 Tax=Thermus sp. TaxID=275 RepID=UPI0025F1631B|nr:DNA-formamidopyrimidine glycosylase [Thermus sp.]MCS6867930.1 DNA-formamidopyrimidine glycosylase [Thermus sp.]MCS7218839.1 DNA-formamidopyrimidine glycosylase [Thermus sp.]MDW8017608.1 DNA-formamidopyrimidine glycosylase [Thermus sp.]MDW8356635.1 DNA-formamidopyrimidine glycosylase [Thermus sp.]
MPELPEVETTRRRLLPLLRGRRLLGVQHEDPTRYRHTGRAEGREVEALDRRGKFLLLALSGGLEMVVHLGMTGGFRLEKTPHTRVRFRLEGGELFFHDPRRFGRIWVVDRGDYREIPLLGRLGPEPLSEGFAFPPFWEGLRRSRKPLKALLLDQTLAAGVGNIYADEALFRAGLSPFRWGRSLKEEEAKRLFQSLRQVLAEAVALGGSTLSDRTYQQPDGLPGGFQERHAVYGRQGLPCPRCGHPLAKAVVGGRGTHFCPACQT